MAQSGGGLGVTGPWLWVEVVPGGAVAGKKQLPQIPASGVQLGAQRGGRWWLSRFLCCFEIVFLSPT